MLISIKPLALLAVFLVSLLGFNQPSDNLINNPGFEEGPADSPQGWITAGDVQLVEDEVHSGERAVRVSAQGGSSRIISNWFEAPPHSRIEVMAWMKASDVVSSGPFHHLRLTLHVYAEDQTTRLTHTDLVSTYGSFDWKQVKGSIIVPEGGVYLRLEPQLTETTGTFWIDDVEARIVQTVPEVDLTGIEAPIILPQPWQVNLTQERSPLDDIEIRSVGVDPRLRSDLSEYLTEVGISYQFSQHECWLPMSDTVLVIGDRTHPDINRAFLALEEETTWEDLGEQGYFISVQPRENTLTIYLGANTDRGLYYALQTLKQIVDTQERSVYNGFIIDSPTLNRRGIIMGVQWFALQEQVFQRMADLKLNFVWNQGSYMNEKFWFGWREPLTAGELENMQNYVALANQHFVDVYITIAPRGETEATPTIYSSEEDINLVVTKMEALYEVGVRNFGLSFDDLVNFGQDRLFGPDIEFFDDDIGAAHAYFILQVYERLSASHDDINLMVVPMVYDRLSNLGDHELAYLSNLGELPPEIEFFSSPEYISDAEVLLETTQRPHNVWDNFYASFYGNEVAPEYVIPLDRPSGFNEDYVAGFTLLPLIPIREDQALISWRTAADYAWSPERYLPEGSFQLAAAKYLGLPVEVEAAGFNFSNVFWNNQIIPPQMQVRQDILAFNCVFVPLAIHIEPSDMSE